MIQQILMTILYIILFILCLSVLVVVHELGHFAAAKFFKVYCKEFSIGFGPSLFHKKRKNGETYFSLRAIPFGGYVAMYGEGMEADPEFANVDPSRSFTAIKKWKRIIILFAGVFNNAVLALILFLLSESCFEQKMMYLNSINVEANSVAEDQKLSDADSISLRMYAYEENGKTVATNNYYVLDKETAYVTYNDDTTKNVYALIDTDGITFTSRSYDDYLKFYLKDASTGDALLGKEITAADTNIKSVHYTVTSTKAALKQLIGNEWKLLPKEPILNPTKGMAYLDTTEHMIKKWNGSKWVKGDYDTYGYTEPKDVKEFYIWYDSEYELTPHNFELGVTTKDSNRVFVSSGLSIYLDRYWNNGKQIITKTFGDFGTSATAIGRGLASLFTSTDNWKEVGGIIAIGQQTTNILQSFGLAKFIYIWGLISVNLAIINLLPFPGLDGWQIVVLIVEAVAHREIPERIKNTVSFIGIAILFAFMIMILIKDFIGLF